MAMRFKIYFDMGKTYEGDDRQTADENDDKSNPGDCDAGPSTERSGAEPTTNRKQTPFLERSLERRNDVASTICTRSLPIHILLYRHSELLIILLEAQGRSQANGKPYVG